MEETADVKQLLEMERKKSAKWQLYFKKLYCVFLTLKQNNVTLLSFAKKSADGVKIMKNNILIQRSIHDSEKKRLLTNVAHLKIGLVRSETLLERTISETGKIMKECEESREKSVKELENMMREKENEIRYSNWEKTIVQKDVKTLRATVEAQRQDLKNKNKALAESEKQLEMKSNKLENCRELMNQHRNETYKQERQIKALEKLIEELRNPGSVEFNKSYKDYRNAESKKRLIDSALKHIIKLAGGSENCGIFLRDILKEVSKCEEYEDCFKLSPEEAFYIYSTIGLSKQNQAKLKKYLKFLLNFDVFPSRKSVDRLENLYSKDDMFDVKTVVDPVTKKKSAVGQLKNLSDMVSTRLTDMASSDKLWFDSCTNDKIWFGIFGDKGSDTTKLVGVLGNTKNPNSAYHLLPLGLYKGNDTSQDIRHYIPEIIDQLREFKKVSYEVDGKKVEKEVVQYLGGDLKFLCSMYGHKGANAKFNCILCKHLNQKNGYTLETFDPAKVYPKRSHEDYKKDAKTESNGLYLDSDIVFHWIPLENIIPPSLHVIMGVAQKYIFNILLDMAYNIDLKNAGLLVGNETRKLSNRIADMKKLNGEISSIKANIKLWAEDVSLLDDITKSLRNHMDDSIRKHKNGIKKCAAQYCLYQDRCMARRNSKPAMVECDNCYDKVHEVCCKIWTQEDRMLADDPIQDILCTSCAGFETPKSLYDSAVQSKAQLAKELEDQKGDLSRLLDKKGTLESGLIEKVGDKRMELEETWSKIGADMSAYYQTFIGNHVYKLLSEEAIEKYMELFPNDQKTNNLRVFIQKLGVIQKMCHSNSLSDTEIDLMEITIKEMIDSLKKALPKESITLKLHMLVSHVPIFARRHKTWAKMCEQSIESYHALFNKLRRRFSCTRNEELKMRQILRNLVYYNRFSDIQFLNGF